MLAQDTRGGCWWDGSRGWTFPPVSHYVLLLSDRWQQRGSLAKWCGSAYEAKVCQWIPPRGKNWVKMAVHGVVPLNSPSKKKFKMQPSAGKVMWLSFWIEKQRSFWISWNTSKPSILTTTTQCWLSWSLELPESRQRRQYFSCKAIMPVPEAFWRLWGTMPVLAGLSLSHPLYSLNLVPSDFFLFGLLCGPHFPSNNDVK